MVKIKKMMTKTIPITIKIIIIRRIGIKKMATTIKKTMTMIDR